LFYYRTCTLYCVSFSNILANSTLAEQKKLTLIDRYENMKGKQRDRVIERRRKKAAARERKNMPAERRSA